MLEKVCSSCRYWSLDVDNECSRARLCGELPLDDESFFVIKATAGDDQGPSASVFTGPNFCCPKWEAVETEWTYEKWDDDSCVVYRDQQDRDCIRYRIVGAPYRHRRTVGETHRSTRASFASWAKAEVICPEK